jgi:hypothetical protein
MKSCCKILSPSLNLLMDTFEIASRGNMKMYALLRSICSLYLINQLQFLIWSSFTLTDTQDLSLVDIPLVCISVHLYFVGCENHEYEHPYYQMLHGPIHNGNRKGTHIRHSLHCWMNRRIVLDLNRRLLDIHAP